MSCPKDNIFKSFKNGGWAFQANSVTEAKKIRNEIIPALLELVEGVAKNPQDAKPEYMGHLYALFLLAEFREPLAFSLVVNIVRLTEEELENLFPVEFLIESAHQILASVFNGDLQALKDLYDDETLDEHNRIAGLKAIFTLIKEGVIAESACAPYFRGKFLEAVEACDVTAVTELVEGISQCQLESLQDLFEVARNKELVDILHIEWNRELCCSKDGLTKIYRLCSTTEKEMSWGGCFR